MKKQSFVLVLLLTSVLASYGQQQEWKTVYSDEFHFFADFPGDPKQTTEDIQLSVGTTSARIWRLELPRITYEVMVADFPTSSVKMDFKSLLAFYEKTCVEIGGYERACKGGYGDDQFGEWGRAGGFRTLDGVVYFHMYLVNKRFYLAKVAVAKAAEKETEKEAEKGREHFLDKFLFTHVDEKTKKLKWGLPKEVSQSRKGN